MEPFIGQLVLFAGNFAPRGWAFCDGQMLDIASHSALFSILGTTYGGDGRSTFALPDLRGRAAIHPGHGPGLTQRRLGERLGAEEVVLSEAQMPTHKHGVQCFAAQGSLGTPINNFMGGDRSGADDLYSATADSGMNASMITQSGSSAAHENMPPSLGISYIIALVGVFPSRS